MNLKISKNAVVCVEAEIHGDVEIGDRTVVHPKAQILAQNGPIIIGTDNLIEECVLIKNTSKAPLYIGNENIFEVSSSFQGKKVGDRNIFEVRSHIGEGTTVADGCVFGIGTNFELGEDISDKMVFYNQDGYLRRRKACDFPSQSTAHITFLHRILPNYHYLKKQQK